MLIPRQFSALLVKPYNIYYNQGEMSLMTFIENYQWYFLRTCLAPSISRKCHQQVWGKRTSKYLPPSSPTSEACFPRPQWTRLKESREGRGNSLTGTVTKLLSSRYLQRGCSQISFIYCSLGGLFWHVFLNCTVISSQDMYSRMVACLAGYFSSNNNNRSFSAVVNPKTNSSSKPCDVCKKERVGRLRTR